MTDTADTGSRVKGMATASAANGLELAKMNATTQRKLSLHRAVAKAITFICVTLVVITAVAAAVLVVWVLPAVQDCAILDTCAGHPDPAKCVFDVQRVLN